MRNLFPTSPQCPRQIKDFLAIMLVLVVGSALTCLGGCQSDPSDPVADDDPPAVSLTWYPGETGVAIAQGQEQEFRVDVSGAETFSATWVLAGNAVGTGDNYTYQAANLGQETLLLEVTADSKASQREWLIDVLEPGIPAVPGIAVFHGQSPGEVGVNWEPIPDGAADEPLTQYLVAMSYSGPITEANWLSADLLGSFATGLAFYTETFTEAQGVIPGAEAWFMVRALGSEGGLSLVEGVFGLEISFPWYIDGYVRDEAGLPLSGIIVNYRDGCAECRVNSDVSGHFQIGPLFNLATVDLETISSDDPPTGEPYTSYYDVRLPTFGYDGSEMMSLDIQLVTRYGLDDGCLIPDYSGSFLGYLCRMTNNHPEVEDRRLLTWAEYPISVYIPLFMGSNGFDMGLVSREMPLLWNTLLDEEFFVLVDAPELADVVFRFPHPDDPDSDLGGSRMGYTKVVLPEGVQLGETIPEAMRVSIDQTLPFVQLTQEVALHELGHVLGYANHSSCPSVRYLMDYSPAGMLDYGPENAIHVDELRTVRAIRYLPQAVDMSIFEYDLEQ